MSKPLVYVAGPYTNPDPMENIHDAVKVGNRLYEEVGVTPIIPHLTGMWHLITPRPYQFWLDYDLEIMRRCDAVYRFPGESSGADAEVAEAQRLGIPVFFDDTWALGAWAACWSER